MNKRKNQRKTGRKLNIRFLVMVGLIMYLSYALISQQASIRVADKDISRLEEEIRAAESQLDMVEDLDAESKSDEYIEKVAREKLGLVLPDETVFVDVTGR